jgi:hypothetical protein
MSPQLTSLPSFAKRLLLFLLVGSAVLFLIKGIYALDPEQSSEPGQERKIKVKEFKGMPLEVVAVRNLQSQTWYEDLEIELKNISNKPIYFLTVALVFPDEKLSWGESGVLLSWGDPKKLDARKFADIDAEHVEPDKTLVVTIPKMYMKGLRAKQRLRPYATKNLILRFEKTYFGDGTGFEVEDWWRDFKGNDPPRKPDKMHHPNRLKAESNSTTSTTEPICGGGNCFSGNSAGSPNYTLCYTVFKEKAHEPSFGHSC